jgi:DNA-binding NarL/FixJ family response regulator
LKAIGPALIIEDHPLYRDALVQLISATLGADVQILVASNAEYVLSPCR